MIELLSPKQIEKIKECGKILKEALLEVKKNVKSGVSAYFLNEVAEKALAKKGAIPSFKNYMVAGSGRYPASLCVSINDEIVHGLPTKHKIIKDGDVVSLDLGAIYNGICTDAAITVGVGEISKQAKELIEVTKKSLELGINEAKAGNHIGDIGNAIQTYAESKGFSVVKDLVGHGIGTKPHTGPSIPNYGKKGEGEEIKNGMALAIEPMITMGTDEVVTDTDNWTVKTTDSSLAAHFEHTVIIVDDEPIIVTN